MDENFRHAQRFGNLAGVLSARATKAAKGIFRHVIAALHRDFLDRVGHFFHRDREKTCRHLFRRSAIARCLVNAIG